jgi:hypothetical protein
MIVKQRMVVNTSNYSFLNARQIEAKITYYNNIISFLFTKWYLSNGLADKVTFTKLINEKRFYSMLF